jgi:hypothetical protein
MSAPIICAAEYCSEVIPSSKAGSSLSLGAMRERARGRRREKRSRAWWAEYRAKNREQIKLNQRRYAQSENGRATKRKSEKARTQTPEWRARRRESEKDCGNVAGTTFSITFRPPRLTGAT